MKGPFTRRQITGNGQMDIRTKVVRYYSFSMEWTFHHSIRDNQGRLIMLGLTFYRRNP